MLKAVNMKGYRFGKNANIEYNGFGMLDTSTGTFVSHDGRRPYTFSLKRTAQSCIDAGWPVGMARVAHA